LSTDANSDSVRQHRRKSEKNQSKHSVWGGVYVGLLSPVSDLLHISEVQASL